MNQDLEHLRLLSIFHYVVAGLGALFSCLPVFHLGLGLMMLLAPEVLEHGPHGNPGALRVVGLFLTAVPAMLIFAGWAIAFCVFLAGQFLGRHRHYTFCLVMADILCMMVPFGTVLGVFTILVLVRPSVKALFDQDAAGSLGNSPPP